MIKNIYLYFLLNLMQIKMLSQNKVQFKVLFQLSTKPTCSEDLHLIKINIQAKITYLHLISANLAVEEGLALFPPTPNPLLLHPWVEKGEKCCCSEEITNGKNCTITIIKFTRAETEK